MVVMVEVAPLLHGSLVYVVWPFSTHLLMRFFVLAVSFASADGVSPVGKAFASWSDGSCVYCAGRFISPRLFNSVGSLPILLD